MVQVGDNVWFFDETAMHHIATVTKVGKDNEVSLTYDYKGATYKERNIPNKADMEPLKDRNVVINCWKERS